MPRPRRKKANDATREQIKQIARDLMAEKGTGGLSLRGIARKLGMSASALYHYYDSLDDLITALLVDAFSSHSAYVRAARDQGAENGQSYAEQLMSGALAYRQWALENPTDFQLIYGSPIPGYEAPFDVTQPAARTMNAVFSETIMAAVEAGEQLFTSEVPDIPPTVAQHIRGQVGEDADPISIQVFFLLSRGWAMLHGLTTLEVHNHLTPVAGDTDAFYEYVVRDYFQSLGLKL